MDPVSHLLFGHTLALTVRRRPSTLGIPAALLAGSIAPDADAILAPIRFDLYLRAHSSGTHSLFGTVVEGVALTLALRLLVKGSRPVSLFVAAWAGLLGHVFWDLADGSDIQLLRPVLHGKFGWHLVSMAEPVVLGGLLLGVFAAWRWPLRARTSAVVTLAFLSAFLVFKKQSQNRARSHFATLLVKETCVAITPQFGQPFTWTFYARTGENIRAWSVNSRTGHVAAVFDYRDASAAPGVVLSRNLPVVRTFLGLSAIPFARVEDDSEHRFVLWSDATSCSVQGCDVSFGGAVDGNMAPLFQVIQIGSFRQARALPGVR